MTKHLTRTCATVAIAASLAALSTPVLAQDAAPATSDAAPAAPAAAPAPAPAPVDAAPAPAAAAPVAPTMTSNPVVQAVPSTPAPVASADPSTAPAVAAPAATARRAPVRTAAARPASSRAMTSAPAAAAPMALTPAAPSTPTVPAADTAPAPISADKPAIALDPAKPAPVAKAADSTTDSGPALLGLLGILGVSAVGLGAFAYSRRRRHDEVLLDDEVVDVPVVNETPADRALEETPLAATVTATPDTPAPIVAPEPAPVMAAADEPMVSEPARDNADHALVAAAPRPFAASGSTTAELIPEGAVPTGEARLALIEQMVAAEPDELNPFRSHKARAKRARIILASREASIRERAREPFDFRTYRPARELDEAQGTPAEAHA